jgi:hypothetical protein
VVLQQLLEGLVVLVLLIQLLAKDCAARGAHAEAMDDHLEANGNGAKRDIAKGRGGHVGGDGGHRGVRVLLL